MTEPRHYSFVRWFGDPKSYRQAIRDAQVLQEKNGATFWRFTQVNDRYCARRGDEPLCGMYLEGWDDAPAEQSPFNPPLVEASHGTR